jgi:hypothetical protein
MDMKVVRQSVSHASIQITADVYSHVMDRLRRGAADRYECYRDAARTNQGQKAEPTL